MTEVNEIISALSDEIKAVKQKYRQHPITVRHLKINSVGGEYFYEGIVGSLEEGDILSIPEGVPVKILCKEYDLIDRQWTTYSRDGKMLYYDSSKHHIVLSIQGPVIDFTDRNDLYQVQPTVEELLMALKAQLSGVIFYPTLFSSQILKNRFLPSLYTYPHSYRINNVFNPSQLETVKKIFGDNITFLWGPPGTGKTTTIAAIIHELLLLKKKVLAVSVSNIAVDQIALKCISQRSYPELKNGEVVRFGYARLQKVRDQDILFPEREHITRLRNEIKELESKNQKTNEPVQKAKCQNDISERQKAIKKATVEPLFKAKAVLTTATQVCMVEEFKEVDFDVLIIDEASMMSVAMVVFLANIPKEKLVIAGDFRQLQPIAIAQTELAYKWLHKDVFELTGITKSISHPLLSMLNVQHRMSEEICDIISKAFYSEKLETNIPDSNRNGSAYPPCPEKIIVFVSVTIKDGSHVQKTESHSRYNIATSERVIEIVNKIVRRPGNIEIGIITPYAAQAQRIKKMVTEKVKSDNNPKYRLIKTGTVHSFQGDESDIIIFDVVDNSIEGPGKLFKDRTGERLFNVAISRARGKLIVIGDPDLFKNRESSFEKISTVFDFIVKNFTY